MFRLVNYFLFNFQCDVGDIGVLEEDNQEGTGLVFHDCDDWEEEDLKKIDEAINVALESNREKNGSKEIEVSS